MNCKRSLKPYLEPTLVKVIKLADVASGLPAFISPD